MNNKNILAEVALYYAEKLAAYGNTPRGVDWNGEEGQVIRFLQLCKIIQSDRGRFSLNDLGCGYGALFDHLLKIHPNFDYLGIDISSEMIQAARKKHTGISSSRFITAAEPDQIADYGMASGIFNVRLGKTDTEWFEYMEATLDVLNRTSSRGFSFNALTSYSDQDKKRDYLYYADPSRLFDLCKRRYSPHVALLHDYGLYEFTILVRKTV